MRKWFLTLVLAALLVFPFSASAQSSMTFKSVEVQLWPEFDQPSMLVIVDYVIPSDTKLPVDLTFSIPAGTNLVAVAFYDTTGTNLVNANYTKPESNGDWQSFTMTVNSMMGHFEYYQTLTTTGDQRSYAYEWDEKYATDAFTARVLEPLDTTSITTEPKLGNVSQKDGLNYYSSDPIKLEAGKSFKLNLKYTKTSNALVASSQAVQPAAPLNDNATGKVSFSNSLPYIIGGVGLVLMIGGVVYFLQAGKKTGTKKSRQRNRSRSDDEENAEGDIYCAQCGARARPNDRFCRTCGSRIRQSED